MDYLKVKTDGNSNPQGKRRVYFTCHPKDFEIYFELICEDIFKMQDCAVFYTEDMSVDLPDEYRDTDLNQMNLFVVPVTFRLLTEDNRAVNSDIKFALEKHIPLLPIMLDDNIDEFYEAKFDKLHYLKRFSRDSTEISYEEKLKKHLSDILIDDKTIAEIKKAFDARIFLSYRKKDRNYANELMQLIHSYPDFRDVAIWYDEFLTPGEDFKDNIENIIKLSDLFTLLVTPNLVNEDNYIKNEEYPMAKKMKKTILPIEMLETDIIELKKQYDGIPDVIDANNKTEFENGMNNALSSYKLGKNADDTMHNYLIGLAYLVGIDVEVNRERGLELISSAAECNLPEAMEKLRDMYYKGDYVKLDWRKYLYWTKQIADYYVKKFSKKDEKSLTWRTNLAVAYGDLGEHKIALELHEEVYKFRCEILGKKHPDTLTSLNEIALTYGKLGNHKITLENFEKVYKLRCKVLGEKHPDTLTDLNNIAVTYRNLGEYKKALEIFDEVYVIKCDTLGENHPRTLTTLKNIAVTYSKLNNHRKALEIHEKVYNLRCQISGENHPYTLNSLYELAITHGELGDLKKKRELLEKVYTLRAEVLGENHPDTQNTFNELNKI